MKIVCFFLLLFTGFSHAQQRICQTTDSIFFSNIVLGESATHTIDVSNCGSGVLILNDVSVLVPNAHFTTSGTCVSGLQLPSNIRCMLHVHYKPQAVGSHNIAIKLYNNSPTPTQFFTAYGTSIPAIMPVVEFYHAGLDHYFMTASTDEIKAIEQGKMGEGWVRTEQVFYTSFSNASFHYSVCRFYGNLGYGPNSHFYTANPTECRLLKDRYQANAKSWRFEGDVFNVKTILLDCPANKQIRRLYNNGFPHKDSNHRYLNSPEVIVTMVSKGWVDEGLVFCSY